MTTWVYERGHLVARNGAGGVLVELLADRSFSPLADLLNACQDLGLLLLAGYERAPGDKPENTASGRARA